MKIKTFVKSSNEIDERVNKWLVNHPDFKITNCYVDSEWITTKKDCWIVTKTCMVTMIIEYEEFNNEKSKILR